MPTISVADITAFGEQIIATVKNVTAAGAQQMVAVIEQQKTMQNAATNDTAVMSQGKLATMRKIIIDNTVLALPEICPGLLDGAGRAEKSQIFVAVVEVGSALRAIVMASTAVGVKVKLVDGDKADSVENAIANLMRATCGMLKDFNLVPQDGSNAVKVKEAGYYYVSNAPAKNKNNRNAANAPAHNRNRYAPNVPANNNYHDQAAANHRAHLPPPPMPADDFWFGNTPPASPAVNTYDDALPPPYADHVSCFNREGDYNRNRPQDVLMRELYRTRGAVAPGSNAGNPHCRV